MEEPGLFVPDSSRFRQKELLGSGGFADVYRPSRQREIRESRLQS